MPHLYHPFQVWIVEKQYTSEATRAIQSSTLSHSGNISCLLIIDRSPLISKLVKLRFYRDQTRSKETVEMDSIAALTDSMRNAHLSDDLGEPEYLLFKPPATTVLTPETLERIPRFLFRVASPLSDGETSETWVRSEAAVTRNGRNLLPLKDIFDNLDSEKRTVVARTLNQHLRWWPKDRDLEDNFMSWTSSLLFALQFISYRHLSSRDGSSLEEIKLYVIDTTLFPRGTFIRDLGLICAFRAFDDHPPGKDLNGLWDLRVNMGSYYFGEYLSQGSLRIENKCQVVSAQALTDEKRLSRLQPLFKEMRPKWANEVRRLRQIIWPDIDEISLRTLSEVTHDQVKAVDEIANLFGHGWRFPMAVYFAGLITQVPEPVPVPKPEHEDEEDEDGDDEPTIRPDDNLFFAYFRAIQISGCLFSSPTLFFFSNFFSERFTIITP